MFNTELARVLIRNMSKFNFHNFRNALKSIDDKINIAII